MADGVSTNRPSTSVSMTKKIKCAWKLIFIIIDIATFTIINVGWRGEDALYDMILTLDLD